MKLINLIKIVPVVLLGFALTVQAQGDYRTSRVIFAQAETGYMTSDYPEIRDTGRTIIFPSVIILMDEQVNELESWMFQPEYLNTESTTGVEAWMLNHDYLSTDNQAVESWMLDNDYLDTEACSSNLESWMLDPAYLAH